MNLIIDIGNTQTKIACIQKGVVLHKITVLDCSPSVIADFLWQHKNIQKAIVSSVRNRPEELLDFLQSKLQYCFFLDAELPIPISNNYQSKNTLGYDRLAACVGAWALCPNYNILVVDAGTAITFDMVTAEKGYIGGCISPGIAMRFKALNTFTKKLPLLEKRNDFKLIGTDTNSAIIGGVENGIVFEIDGYIRKLHQQYVNLKVMVTGGDADFIVLHTTQEVEKQKDLLLLGLDTILNYQIGRKRY